jgi:Leucine-rich repeat (LRR) protein
MCEKTTDSADLCPSGYTYDIEAGTCTLVETSEANCTCSANVMGSNQTIISGETTNVALTSTAGGIGYTWTVVQSGITGASSGTGSTIAQTLTGLGTATYTVTPYEIVSGCLGTPINIVVTVGSVNFDVTSTNWGSLTTESAWESFFSSLGATTAIISNFSLVSGRVRFNIATDVSNLYLVGKNITTVSIIDIPSVTILNLQDNHIVTFNPVQPLPSGLLTLSFLGNNIVTFNPSIALPSSLTTLDFQENSIVTFNPSIALPISLTKLVFVENNIATFNPTIALPSSLEQLLLNRNNIVTFNPTIALPPSLKILALQDNSIVTFNPTSPLPSLENLVLKSNDLTTFNPTSPLPSLQNLELSQNNITVSSWNTDSAWVASVPSGGTINAVNNATFHSITGTATETALLAKTWTIIP